MRPTGPSILYIVCSFILPVSGQIFDTSICTPTSNDSDASPLPALSESYSTTVEWKLLHNNSTVSIEEYVIGMEKLSSIRVTKEGHTSKIIYDENAQQYTEIDIVNNLCNTHKYVLDVVLFGEEIWKSTTKQLYQIFKQSITEYGGTQIIRSTVVQRWSTCVFLLEYNVTLAATFFFAADGWPMPFAAPNAMVPVRLELRGSVNGMGFHAVGDYVNFLPSPPANLDSVQDIGLTAGVTCRQGMLTPPRHLIPLLVCPETEPGMFCPGKDIGKIILSVPSDFSTVIERVNTHDKQVTYDTIWFDSRRKFVRYETKSASGEDVDPNAIVFDFHNGVRYSMDRYTTLCNPTTIIERGDKFVDQTAVPSTRIQMQSSLDFFKMRNATIQYVGKRYTRRIFCDVWVGLYYDLNIGQNQTVEWYFLGEGWQEGIGTSITPGSLVRFDVWAANSDFPIIHNVLKLDPSTPYLTSFDIGPCFTGSLKRQNFVIKFTANGLDLTQISLNYIQDQIQEILTTQAQLDNLRFSHVAFDNYGFNEWYFSGVLLDKSPVDNFNVYPPVLMKEPLSSAFDFLRGFVETPWVYNISQPKLQLVAIGIQPLYYRNDFTTTTTLPTTTGTYQVPTLPVHTTGTTSMPTPAPPPTGTTQTTKANATTAPPPTGTTQTTKANPTSPCTPCSKVTCPTRKTCPKVTCPLVTSPPTSTPCSACPTCPKVQCPITTTPRPMACPKITCPVTPSKIVTSAPSTTLNIGVNNPAAQSQTSTKGVSSGGAVGIAFACLIIGFLIGAVVVYAFQKKFPNIFKFSDSSYINPVYDSEKY